MPFLAPIIGAIGSTLFGSTAAALGTSAAIGAGTSIASGIIGSGAAKDAARTQAQAAEEAAQLNYKAQQEALAFQKDQFGTSQANLAPYLGTGRNALAALNKGMGFGTPSYSTVGPSGAPQLPTTGGGTNAGGMGPSTFTRGAPAVSTSAPPAATAPSQLSLPTTTQNALASRLRQGRADVPGAPEVNGSNVISQVRNTFGTNPTPPRTYDMVQGPDGSYVPGPSGASPAGAPPGGYPLTANSLDEQYGTPFAAPTDVTEQNDPGYKFRLQQGQQALERSAAAGGNLFTGGTAKDLASFGQDYASNEYNNVYNRSLGQYQQAYNIFQNNQTGQFNRLAALAGLGQTATSQLTSAGANAGAQVGNTLQTGAAQQSQQLNNAAAARGSGYVGSANAVTNAIGGATSAATLPLYLSLLSKQNAPADFSDSTLYDAVGASGGY